MKQLVAFLLIAVTLFPACRYFGGERIKGDGNVTIQNRSVSDFRSIDAGGATEIYVSQDSVYSVKVEIDNNLQEYIEVYKEGDELNIHQKNNTNLDATGKIKIYVTAPVFEKLKVSGACNIIGKNSLSSTGEFFIGMSGACNAELNIKAPKVSVDLSGACSVNLSGATKDFKADGSGSTNIKCFGLMTENTSVELSGSGDAEVFASVKLEVNVSGAADVKYKGNPAVNQKVSGAGSVKKVDTPNP